MKLTVRDAAKLLHTSERAIYRYIREKSIPFHRVDEHYRFHSSELLEWATSRGVRISSEEFRDEEANGTAAPSFAETLATGGVHYGVRGEDRGSVLRAVVECMPIDPADRDMVCDFLLAREALGSTGVGEGIAIPHVRNPIVLNVDRPSITLCFLEKPVDFEAVDGKPVNTIFSVVSPTIRGHLSLLSRIAAALHDPEFKRAILARAPKDEILAEARRVEGALRTPKVGTLAVTLLLSAIATLLGGGLLALAGWRSAALASGVGATSAVVGCSLGLAHAANVLRHGSTGVFALRWEVPYGWMRIETDPLSAFFLVPLFGLGAAAAVYAVGYLRSSGEQRPIAPAWLAFNWFLASMAAVVVARQAVLFLVAWEVMVLLSFVCMTFEYERAEVTRAGWVYLIASHVGTASLIALFLLFGRQAHSFDFASLREAAPAPAISTLLVVLAMVGFGIKAGFVPLHVWLPEAHAAAPSHVSALMSGVLIKMGLYGLLRTLVLLRTPPTWAGPALVGIGLLGAAVGIALASYQRDLKRVLAYSSVENMGLITLGVGLALWGWTSGRPQVAALGMAGALLHTWNHTLMKGLMFLSAGSVLHGTGTKDIERLGGLLRRMPRTGSLMLLGSLAIAGLPPLNGFVSEWLLYLAMMRAGLASSGAPSVLAMFAVGAVSLVGALAGLAFVRLVGMALLGQPRSEAAARSHESPWSMVLPMAGLAALSVCIGILPQRVIGAVSAVANQLLRSDDALTPAGAPIATLAGFDMATWVLVGLIGALAAVLIRSRPTVSDATWGCGYAEPTARMQYTARSFSETLSEHLLPAWLRPRVSATDSMALFPDRAVLASDCEDPLTRGFYEPFLDWWADRFARLRWMQQGLLHVYVVYILVALLLGLAWSSAVSWRAG